MTTTPTPLVPDGQNLTMTPHNLKSFQQLIIENQILSIND